MKCFKSAYVILFLGICLVLESGCARRRQEKAAKPGRFVPSSVLLTNFRPWRYYQEVTAVETAGLERKREPVHIYMTFDAEEVTDLSQEVRVAEEVGRRRWKEVPCQIYDEIRRPAALYARIVFLTDMEPGGKKKFRIYWGNPNPPDRLYTGALSTFVSGAAMSVENSFYRVNINVPRLDEYGQPIEESGQIDEIVVKAEEEMVLTSPKGNVHWTPDVCYPATTRTGELVPRWSHIWNWEMPPNMVSFTGAVASGVLRRGDLRNFPDIYTGVSYIFYLEQPYFVMASETRVKRPIRVYALRNGEMVFNSDLFTHLIWQEDEYVKEIGLEEPEEVTEPLAELAPDVPWLAFINKETGLVFAGLNLEYANERSGGPAVTAGPSTLVENKFYIYCHYGITYWTRGLVMGLHRPKPYTLLDVAAGSTYREKVAYLVFVEKEPELAATRIKDYYQKLTHPLQIEFEE
ncbi:MAG: hypothetical protein AMS15_04250 [Planctomycetes bacterium DG_23]|nr:MAG: hypothetical protein AMS15_04250 [Planctomycetes bacterium DG_23]